jgi:hypothetical protein
MPMSRWNPSTHHLLILIMVSPAGSSWLDVTTGSRKILTHMLGAFSGETFKFMRGALDDAQASSTTTFCLHDALLEMLLAYLPSKAAKEWRDMRAAFVWHPNSPHVWAELSRVYDLRAHWAQLG